MPEEKVTFNIHQKLLKIADAAGILRKSKSGFNFKYVPEEDIQAKVTANMQQYGVMLYNSIVPGTFNVTPYTYSKYDKKAGKEIPVNEFVVKADTLYTWVNAENPSEQLEIPWIIVASMEDASQAFGAAVTYCNRYFLMKTLQLATSEDDPDSYRSKQKEAESYGEEKEQKKLEELLKKATKDIVDMGSELIRLGIQKDDVMNIVGKYNEGNKNPSSIKSVEVCAAIIKEFEELKNSISTKTTSTKKTTPKKENKE